MFANFWNEILLAIPLALWMLGIIFLVTLLVSLMSRIK